MKIKIEKTTADKSTPKVVFPSQLKKKENTNVAKNNVNSMKYLGYFILVVGICILIALTARFTFLYKKSTFTTNSYSVVINTNSPFIVSYNKDLKKITLINLENFNAKNPRKAGLLLGVPIDGELNTSTLISSKNFSKVATFLNLTVHPLQSQYIGLTVIDIGRLMYLSMSIPNSEIQSEKIAIKNDEVQGLTPERLYDVFKDSSIIEEALSVEVVNATSVEGLAGKVSLVLKNTGCNIISISSADQNPTSKIYAAKTSKTLIRISHILSIPVEIVKNLSSQADIKIVLGDSFAKSAGLY